MKKFLFAALTLTLFLTAAYSQDDIQKSDWRRFQPPQEEFSAEFPQAVAARTDLDDKGILREAFYSVKFNKTYFFVHSSGGKTISITGNLERFIRANQPKKSEGKIGRFSGTAYDFRDAENFYHRILEIRTQQRFYVFHTISEIENDFEVERFFDSIRFVSQPDEKLEPRAVERPDAPENTNQAVVTPADNNNKGGSGSGIGSGNGIGIGSGRGTGIGSGTSVQNPAPVQPGQTFGVKILSKPRANYTDLARTYDIMGVVRVRLTFQADGQIGAVSPVTRLPLGLTTSAMEAARKIRFEPAVKNGVPYSVTKIVEYTFTLY
ncbi:MAG: energy transducer TonB [Acidobacteriota bacterium]|nr:energy transducer TonB [Acidobacteriota bacterium]